MGKKLTAELRVSEARLHVATDAAEIGVWERDIPNDRLYWDDRMFELYGISKADFGGTYEDWKRCVHPADLKQAVAEVHAAESGEKPFSTEFRIIRPDGQIRHIRAFGKVILDEEGRADLFIGTNQDVTERREIEARLRSSEALKEKIVANIGDVIVIIDPDGITRYKSPNLETIFGWKPEELVGRPATDLIHPDDRQQAMDFMERLAQSPGKSDVIRVRYPRKNGTYRWVEFCGSSFLDDPDIRGILGNYHDITDRVEAEVRLRASEQLLRCIIESSTDMFYSHTPDHVLTYVSPQVRKILGYEEEMVMARWTEFITEHPANVLALQRTEEAIRTGGAQPAYEMQFRHKDGHPVWVEVHESPVVEKGKTVAIVGSVTDITARKATQAELQQKIDELERFNRAAVGRELRMAELKQEINALCRQLGRAEVYSSQKQRPSSGAGH